MALGVLEPRGVGVAGAAAFDSGGVGVSGLAILSAPTRGNRAKLTRWTRMISDGSALLVASVTLVLATGCATEAATSLGQSKSKSPTAGSGTACRLIVFLGSGTR
jgi:hypothetical protein